MTAQPDTTLDLWDRHEEQVLDLLPYVLLAMSTVGAIATDIGTASKVLVDGGVAAATALWMLWMFTLHPAWRERRARMAVFFAVLMALTAILVINDPIFGFFSWTGYIWTVRVLRGDWRFAGVAATALVTGTSQHGGLPSGSAGSWIAWVAIVLVNFGLASGFTWLGWTREEEREVRRQAIEELTEANAKLEASLRENAGLHAQLLVQAREAGVLDERQRMAREIHDTLAQGLVGIITQLEAAAQAVPTDPEWRRHADAAVQLARDSLAEARRSVKALQPEPLEHEPLPDALATVTGRWQALTGIEASVTTTGRRHPTRPDIEQTLLRTLQEALANVAKHSGATRVAVTLSYMDDLVSLDVRDDGVGFVPRRADRRDGGFGLTAMRQRVEGLAGAVEIESEPGAGTTVAACIPLITVGEPV